MRIIVSDFISLDGVVQAPGGKEEDTDGGFEHGGWSMPYFDPEVMGSAIDELMQGTEALLFGRRTWEKMADAWPEQSGDAFADRMNAIPKYVVSRTVSPKAAAERWNNTTLLESEDALGAVRALRAKEGAGAIQVMGSASLVQQLVKQDLVDEYRLMIEPILLGGGKTLFPSDGQRRPLRLTSVSQASTGVLICSFQPAPEDLEGAMT